MGESQSRLDAGGAATGGDGQALDHEQLARRVSELEAENGRLAERLAFETTGRTRAEKKLREKFVLETGGAGQIRPVGHIATCFPSRFGTPRQGSLADLSRGVVQLDKSVVGYHSLTGLEGFSHVWVLFVFHENTNMHKLAGSEEAPRHRKIFPSFVKPPQGGGIKVGLFATRTPHRPNPVGLSLARVHAVDVNKGQVHLRGVDLVDGTPILDLKPYVGHVDRVPEAEARLAPWVTNERFDLAPVHFEPEAQRALLSACAAGKARWFKRDEGEALLSALAQVIALDPRGVIHGRGEYKAGAPSPSSPPANKEHLFRDDFVLDFDAFQARFSPHSTERGLVVTSVELREGTAAHRRPLIDLE